MSIWLLKLIVSKGQLISKGHFSFFKSIKKPRISALASKTRSNQKNKALYVKIPLRLIKKCPLFVEARAEVLDKFYWGFFW